MERSLYIQGIKDLAFRHNKMAFLTGPRQTGKTTLALSIGDSFPQKKYYNWDDVEFQKKWIKNPKQLVEQTVQKEKPLLILDELHKAPRWKNTLKGLYDTSHSLTEILVTGSAKLDVFRRGGDSLLGRYFLFHLHPFSLGELTQSPGNPDNLFEKLLMPLPSFENQLDQLLRFGGFPDPFLKQDMEFYRAWQRMRLEKLIREDLIDLTRVHEVSLIQSMAHILPEKVGSLFSLQSVCEDLQINHPTAKRWLGWLEQLFYIFTIPPYSSKITRSIRKQPKIYLWDWSVLEDSAAKFENLVASHLLKSVHWWNDTGKGNFELYFVRDKEKREVDFLITKEKKPWLLVECKENDTEVSPNLAYFSALLKPQRTLQIVREPGIHRKFDAAGTEGTIISAGSFLPLLF